MTCVGVPRRAGVSFVHAEAAIDWLLAQSNPDGSLATAADLATPYQATAEAVRALRTLGQGGSNRWGHLSKGTPALRSDA